MGASLQRVQGSQRNQHACLLTIESLLARGWKDILYRDESRPTHTHIHMGVKVNAAAFKRTHSEINLLRDLLNNSAIPRKNNSCLHWWHYKWRFFDITEVALIKNLSKEITFKPLVRRSLTFGALKSNISLHNWTTVMQASYASCITVVCKYRWPSPTITLLTQ